MSVHTITLGVDAETLVDQILLALGLTSVALERLGGRSYQLRVIPDLDDAEVQAFVKDLSPSRERSRLSADKRTQKLLEDGFEFPSNSGNFFSLSLQAQIDYANFNAARDLLTYPVYVPLRDRSNYFECPDSATMQQLFLESVTRRTSLLELSKELHAQINAATGRTDLPQPRVK